MVGTLDLMRRPRTTEGATLIITVLIVMVILAAILAVTAQFSLASRRSSADQDAMLRSQYAAEAGIARAQAQLEEIRQSISKGKLDQNTTPAQMQAIFANFCRVPLVIPISTTPLSSSQNICTASTAGSNTTGLAFKALVTPDNYPSGWSTSGTEWDNLFSSTGLVLNTGDIASNSASTALKIVPVGVTQTALSNFVMTMQLQSVRSAGISSSGTRVITAKPLLNFQVTLYRPAFSQFAQFRNETTSTSGGGLYFASGETFNGPVHTNKPIRFSGNGSSGPVFNDEVSTAASSPDLSNVPCSVAQLTTAGACPSMFPKGTRLKTGVQTVSLPSNNYDQLRVALGLSGNSGQSAMTDPDMISALGLTGTTLNNGVYFSKTSGQMMGGIYIKGDADMTLSTTTDNPRRQVMTFKQVNGATTTTTTLTKDDTGTWLASVNGAPAVAMSGVFNGVIYAEGNLNMYGDGTDSPDIAGDSALTVTCGTRSNGNVNYDIKLKNSITYADDPTSNDKALNVLGIFNSTGSVLLDGPKNQDMNINASILASKAKEGFGTVNPDQLRYSSGFSQPYVRLTGGVIEDQSQTVAISPGGYRRNYTYDPRFRTGFSPPFFPLQQQWQVSTNNTFGLGVWTQDKS